MEIRKLRRLTRRKTRKLIRQSLLLRSLKTAKMSEAVSDVKRRGIC